jgi:maltooligosyltrehalose trehalohydrolase
LARVLAKVWPGKVSSCRGTRGEPSAQLPSTSLVSFIQNHDHIGDRPFGERIGQLVPREASRALAAIYLLSAQVPLIFMGEEWGAKQPFLFFSDMEGELAEKIRKGRADETGKFPGIEAKGTPPDPESEDSFLRSKLRGRP